MNTLSTLNNRFEYLGKSMPIEFKDICKEDRFQVKILNRSDNPTRFHKLIIEFLETKYGGDLPKSLYLITKKLDFEDYKQDLYSMNESEYRVKYPERYKDFFENQSWKEKGRIFWATDFGARSIFEYEQDVVAGTIIEKMMTYHSKGILAPNEKSSGYGNGISTICDFIFRNPRRADRPDALELPIELKTKWQTKLDSVVKVEMRGSVKTLMETRGMVISLYPWIGKAAVIDPVGKQYTIERGVTKSGKECDVILVPKVEYFDFNLWDKDDMMKLLHLIYDLNKERETR